MRDIDGKFTVSADGTQIVKKSNGEAIPEDEPLFLLRARDKLAIPLLEYYRRLSMAEGCNEYHFIKLEAEIEKFKQFAKDNKERMKQPSITRGL